MEKLLIGKASAQTTNFWVPFWFSLGEDVVCWRRLLGAELWYQKMAAAAAAAAAGVGVVVVVVVAAVGVVVAAAAVVVVVVVVVAFAAEEASLKRK